MIEKIRYILYRIRWAFADIYHRRPIHLDLEVTTICNHQCVYCFHSLENVGFRLGEMDCEKAIAILEDAYNSGCRSVKFNLRGEPLLYKSLPKLCEVARGLGYIDIMINTNLDVNYALVAKAIESGLNNICVSFNATTEEGYKRMHGKNADFYGVLSNIFMLSGRKNDIRLSINCHLNKLNKEECFEDHFGGLRRGYKINYKMIMDREGVEKVSIFSHRKNKRYCGHINRRMVVTLNGNIYPCCVCYKEPKDIRVGKWRKSGDLLKAWNSLWLKVLRRDIRSGKYYSQIETCKNCTSEKRK